MECHRDWSLLYGAVVAGKLKQNTNISQVQQKHRENESSCTILLQKYEQNCIKKIHKNIK